MIIAFYGPDSMGRFHTQKFNAGDTIPSAMIFCNEMVSFSHVK